MSSPEEICNLVESALATGETSQQCLKKYLKCLDEVNVNSNERDIDRLFYVEEQIAKDLANLSLADTLSGLLSQIKSALDDVDESQILTVVGQVSSMIRRHLEANYAIDRESSRLVETQNRAALSKELGHVLEGDQLSLLYDAVRKKQPRMITNLLSEMVKPEDRFQVLEYCVNNFPEDVVFPAMLIQTAIETDDPKRAIAVMPVILKYKKEKGIIVSAAILIRKFQNFLMDHVDFIIQILSVLRANFSDPNCLRAYLLLCHDLGLEDQLAESLPMLERIAPTESSSAHVYAKAAMKLGSTGNKLKALNFMQPFIPYERDTLVLFTNLALELRVKEFMIKAIRELERNWHGDSFTALYERLKVALELSRV